MQFTKFLVASVASLATVNAANSSSSSSSSGAVSGLKESNVMIGAGVAVAGAVALFC